MLVCQCNVITDRDIKEVVLDLLREDPWAIIVPAKVYRELEKRCKCSGCVPNVVDIITKVTEEYHLQQSSGPAKPVAIAAPRSRLPRQSVGASNARRRTSNRAA